MTTIKIVCEKCKQIYTFQKEVGFYNSSYSLLKSSKVLNDKEILFSQSGHSHKRVCGNCYNTEFKIYF